MNKWHLTPRMVKQFRKTEKWSAAELAAELGYTRGYIKSIEGGSLAITARFAKRFMDRRAQAIGERVARRDYVSPYRLPKRLVIVPKAKICPVCRWPFIGVTPNQVCCGDACASERRARNRRDRSRQRKALKRASSRRMRSAKKRRAR